MYIKRYEEFINEGNVSSFFIKSVLWILNGILSTYRRIKGTHISMNFKRKSDERKFDDGIAIMFDVLIFEKIKIFLSKKIKNEVYKTSFSSYIKEKNGYDIYKICDDLINILNIENLEIKDESELPTIQQTVDIIKKAKAVFKQLDDEILERM